MDNDGDLDVVSASATGDGKIAWHVNEDGEGTFGAPILVDQDIAPAQDVHYAPAHEVHTVDIDNDGDFDVLAAFVSDGRLSIGWYENLDGKGAFSEVSSLDHWTENVADYGPSSLMIEDVDGDGRQDAILFSRHDGAGLMYEVAWFQNLAGTDAFSDRRVIYTNPMERVDFVDFDGDGDVDFLTLGKSESISVDTDGDGRGDIISLVPETVTLHENAGNGTFTQRQLFTEENERPLHSFHAADIDRDGDLDVLTASVDISSGIECEGSWPPDCFFGELSLAWRENTDGLGAMGDARTFATFPNFHGSYYTNGITAVDVDHDGDLDAVAVSSKFDLSSADDKVVWYENIDGKGTFGVEQIITTDTNGIRALVVADIDSDGDADFVSASSYDGKITWYESDAVERQRLFDEQGRLYGDANGDGLFTSADLVQVFQAGKYEANDALAEFSSGDWNGDGYFDSSDLVVAFQARAYE